MKELWVLPEMRQDGGVEMKAQRMHRKELNKQLFLFPGLYTENKG